MFGFYPKHCGTVPLETERLILRPLTLDDCEAIHRNWGADTTVYEYMTTPVMPQPEDVELFLRRKLQAYKSELTYYWGIFPKDVGECVGMVTVTEVGKYSLTGNLAYALGQPWWGKGYAKEASEAVLRLMFDTVGLRLMYGCHFVGNDRSGATLRSLGMRFTGRSQTPISHHGRMRFFDSYELSRKDYVTRIK